MICFDFNNTFKNERFLHFCMGLNPLAEELNEKIKKDNPIIFDMLSEKGKAIFFPYKGILGQTAEAKGKRINATVGSAIEDDNTIMRLPTIAKQILIDPKDAFPYAPSYGKPELRKAWQELIKEKNPSLKANISLPVVTNALTHGLSMVGYMFLEPGDKVILTDKFWGNYKLIFQNAYSAQLDLFNTFKDDGFDTESLKEKLEEPGKKILLLNFPNNPAGYTPTDQETKDIVDMIKKCAEVGNKVIVICDDAYFGLVYKDGVFTESIFALLADLHENVLAIKIDGATKEDYVWGFRVGFITYASKGMTDITADALAAKTAGAIRGNVSNCSHLGQSLVLEALKSPDYEKEKKEKNELLKARFLKVDKVLEDKKYSDFFTALPHNSGYFMCIELKEGIDAEKVRKILLDKYETGVIAIGNILRLAYSSVAEKDMQDLFDNIYNACKEV